MQRLVVILCLLLWPLSLIAADTRKPWAGDFGLPAGTAVDYTTYIYCHNTITNNPTWVAHIIQFHDEPSPERENKFFADDSIPAEYRTRPTDWKGTGYNRGHQCPAGDMMNRYDQDRTYMMSNMLPQDPDNNQFFWKNGVERSARQMPSKGQWAIAITGPLYPDPNPDTGEVIVKTIGPHHNWVPDRLWKVVTLVENWKPLGERAWLCKNKPIDHTADERDYRVTPREIELLAHLNFNSNLPQDVQDQMELVK